jgi:pimeloyl-ACP methyl ester carboxylesterase
MICLVRDIPVYYEVYGEGKPILCIHGFSCDHHIMAGCLEPIFAQMQGYRRIYLDLPGMGKTPSATWLRNADDMLETITEFIQAVIFDENFLLVGESYGGYLALGLVHSMQVRIDGVMLICPAINTKVSERKLPEKCVLHKSSDLYTTMNTSDVSNFLQIAVIATPEIYQKYKKDILSGISTADARFLQKYHSEGYGFTFEDELKTILFNKPTTILTGRQDHVVGYLEAFEILNQFPRASYVVLDCAGHNLQIERESVFMSHVKDWIWRIEIS